MKDHIVMAGNPVDGFKFIGPFTRGEAFAEFQRLDAVTDKVGAVWVVPLTLPATAG
jgi:hypothetical protein